MRIAILSDIHSNLAAFEAVLADLQGQAVDHVVINGDVINGGPDPRECLDLARATGYTLLAGNHERYIRDYDLPVRPPEWASDLWKPSLWTVNQFSQAERAALHNLATTYHTDDLLVVHASPRHDQDSVFAITPQRELAAMFVDTPQTIIRSHNHIPQFRPWDGRMIVTTGAVGQPLDGNPWAKYAIAERKPQGWRVKHRVVMYDIETTVKRFHSSGYYEAAYPMSRLYLREVQLGTHHVVPFLRLHQQWLKADPQLSSEQAVKRFLEL